jgi:hypothetical protein
MQSCDQPREPLVIYEFQLLVRHLQAVKLRVTPSQPNEVLVGEKQRS